VQATFALPAGVKDLLTPEQLESAFRKEHEFRAAIVRANELQRPKPDWLGGLFPFLLKAIPPKAVSDLIVNGGRALIESRRKAAEEDQPQKAQEPKKPHIVRASEEGRPKKDSRSGVSFVGTFVEPEKPVPKPE